MKISVQLPALVSLVSLGLSACGYAPNENSSIAAEAQADSFTKAARINGAVCGKLTSRSDHGLEENPVLLSVADEANPRLVHLEGSAFERALEFVMLGEKEICLNADWAESEIPTINHFALVSVPDFHGEEGAASSPLKTKVKDGNYSFAQCLSKADSDLGGHATLNVNLRVKAGFISEVSAPALEFAPAINGKYLNSSTFVDNQGNEILSIELGNGTLNDGEEVRHISEIQLNLTEKTITMTFPVSGHDDVHFSSITATNCKTSNETLLKDLMPSK